MKRLAGTAVYQLQRTCITSNIMERFYRMTIADIERRVSILELLNIKRISPAFRSMSELAREYIHIYQSCLPLFQLLDSWQQSKRQSLQDSRGIPSMKKSRLFIQNCSYYLDLISSKNMMEKNVLSRSDFANNDVFLYEN
ncbi:1,4-alpha-glucan branching enzyme GlgB [Dirofilaria immitis]